MTDDHFRIPDDLLGKARAAAGDRSHALEYLIDAAHRAQSVLYDTTDRAQNGVMPIIEHEAMPVVISAWTFETALHVLGLVVNGGERALDQFAVDLGERILADHWGRSATSAFADLLARMRTTAARELLEGLRRALRLDRDQDRAPDDSDPDPGMEPERPLVINVVLPRGTTATDDWHRLTPKIAVAKVAGAGPTAPRIWMLIMRVPHSEDPADWGALRTVPSDVAEALDRGEVARARRLLMSRGCSW